MATSRLRVVIAALAFGVMGCMTMRPPAAGWVATAPAALGQTMGGTILLKYRDRHGFHEALGELIAIEPDDVLVLSAAELSAIRRNQVTHYEIKYRDPVGAIVAIVGARPGEKQKPFARFPQGVPDRAAFQQSLSLPSPSPAPAARDSLAADSLKR